MQSWTKTVPPFFPLLDLFFFVMVFFLERERCHSLGFVTGLPLPVSSFPAHVQLAYSYIFHVFVKNIHSCNKVC